MQQSHNQLQKWTHPQQQLQRKLRDYHHQEVLLANAMVRTTDLKIETTETKNNDTYHRSIILPNWMENPQVDISMTNSKHSHTAAAAVINHRHCVQNQHSRATPANKSFFQRPSSAASVTPRNSLRMRAMFMLQGCHLSDKLHPFALLLVILLSVASVTTTEGMDMYESTTPMHSTTRDNQTVLPSNELSSPSLAINTSNWQELDATTSHGYSWRNQSQINGDSDGSGNAGRKNSSDSIFMRFAKRFSTGNELWDDIIRDCYQQPTVSCFQKNVFTYLNGALDAHDVNVTQRLKFYRNQVDYADMQHEPTEAAAAKAGMDGSSEEQNSIKMLLSEEEQLLSNEIPHEEGRATKAHTESETTETPIEEVTNALYGKSVKFAMTHDMEIKLPEMMFDGATFRISPRSFEGNGIIAKLELIPKQEVEARLAGKIIMKKIQKFLRSKLLLSFLALVLIIKIIKIKLFWLLPLVIGVGAAKKLLLKFLLFLFPALSHLFKLCSYYQQTYHSTKYHHHHHLIDHHHTVVPAWHAPEHHSIPEIIYTHPPKGHPSTYLHGAPIHENYGPYSLEHNEGNWENSGPGLGSDYIGDINRSAQVDENSNYFKPNANKDANEILVWGLGTTQRTIPQQQQQHQQQRYRPVTQQQPPTQQHRPPSLVQQQKLQLQQQQQLVQQKLKTQQKQQQTHNLQKPHATSHSFNPFLNGENNLKQSLFATKLKSPAQAQSAPNPVYAPPPAPPSHPQQPSAEALTAAAHIAAQYDPARNSLAQQQQKQDQLKQQQLQQLLKQQQQQLSPELAAQLKEALRIQAEHRIISQQQQILDKQPFVQDGQPIMPKNYDPFYSPILLKIDKIVEQLGVTDDLCKERLICSMYKDPTRYSPHSNFVSAELSRDTSELQPVSNPNGAVVRFYRFIQAARDGQDQRDCLRLYPQCNINTE
ncbi:uncharacterized protein LOC126756284 [Bactrocera neohumeralis]|uniref:uncharacterized protein LOC126756284 n=1 Tax=Bactrocera neohumeralis TaxID=98809 RepID=UPI0021667D33|nr:uncharacterized protein LOC126756284 [Bactrocera neohumeralis]